MDEKLETQAAQLAAIDQATLTPLVQSAMGSETVEVVNWQLEQLHGGVSLETTIYRFAGQGRDQGQKVPFATCLGHGRALVHVVDKLQDVLALEIAASADAVESVGSNNFCPLAQVESEAIRCCRSVRRVGYIVEQSVLTQGLTSRFDSKKFQVHNMTGIRPPAQ